MVGDKMKNKKALVIPLIIIILFIAFFNKIINFIINIKWFKEVNGSEYILPPNSFKESGTGVRTKLLVFYKE